MDVESQVENSLCEKYGLQVLGSLCIRIPQVRLCQQRNSWETGLSSVYLLNTLMGKRSNVLSYEGTYTSRLYM